MGFQIFVAGLQIGVIRNGLFIKKIYMATSRINKVRNQELEKTSVLHDKVNRRTEKRFCVCMKGKLL